MRRWLEQRLGGMWRRRQAAGLVVLAVIWLPAVDVWWLGPQRVELAQRRDALAQMRAEIAGMRKATARLAAVEAEVTGLEARVHGAGAVRRETGETASLLRRVELLAGEAGLAIRGFTPRAAVEYELHSEWPTRLELSGSYPALLAFFERLANCAAYVVVDDLEIRAVDVPGADGAVAAACTITMLGLDGGTEARDARATGVACPSPAGGRAAAPDAAAQPADPFSRWAPAADRSPVAARIPGLPGLRVGELTLQGLVRTADGTLAVVAAPGGETYLVRGGEQLLDGAVVAVQADAVVFREDRAGAVRETRRTLADAGDGR